MACSYEWKAGLDSQVRQLLQGGQVRWQRASEVTGVVQLPAQAQYIQDACNLMNVKSSHITIHVYHVDHHTEDP